MKKSCYLCRYSEEVKYNWKTNYGCGSYSYYKENTLFCISAPPNSKNKFSWDHVTKGLNKLRKYCKYPEVSTVACCSLYCETESKKKIKRYEEILEEEKRVKDKEKLKKQNIQKEKEKARIKKRLELEKIKAKKDKKKKEKLRKKKRLESQKRYRLKKKNKKIEQLKKTEEYNRFDILDI